MPYKVKIGTKYKKIYSKVKDPVLITENKIENPIQTVSEIFKINNVWSDFIDRAIYKNEEIETAYEHDLRNIMACITDCHLQSKIFELLMAIKNYNPFKDEIPLEQLPVNYRNLLKKTIIQLKNKKGIVQNVIKTGEELELKINDIVYYAIVIPNANQNINEELFQNGIDIIVIKGDNRLIVSSNPHLEQRPDFTSIFNKLEDIEPNKWYLHGTKGMLCTRKGEHTSLSSKQLIDILSE